jgi:hypothetical protein
MMATLVTATLGIVACEGDDKAIAPLVDTTPPAVSITNIVSSKTTLTTTVKAEDYISVYFIVTGRNTSASVTTTWLHPYTATTEIQVRGIGVDSQANEGSSTAGHVIVVVP